MATNESVKVKDLKTGVVKSYNKQSYERLMSTVTFAGKKRFQIVSGDEKETVIQKAATPEKKKVEAAESAESEALKEGQPKEGSEPAPETASEKFIREHNEKKEEARKNANQENQK